MVPPPPPSQAGKFKPRKPAKKVRVGASTSITPGERGAFLVTNADPAVAAAATATSSGPGTVGREGGGRGGGRFGGGRGRGRGRLPVQQGQVFFTGQAKAASSAASRSSGGRGARSGGSVAVGTATGRGGGGTIGHSNKNEGVSIATQEEIVGVLEDDPNARKPDSILSQNVKGESSLDYYEEYETAGSRTGGSSSVRTDAIFYDSESSEDEIKAAFAGQSRTLQPLVLPFPNLPTRVGIGGKRNNHGIPKPDPSAATSVPSLEWTRNDKKSKEENIIGQAAATAPSPFVDIRNEQAMKWEENGWFLVQLPTRLPKTAKEDAPETEAENSDSALFAGATAAPDAVTSSQPTLTSAAAELATTQVTLPPVQTDRFDNNLATAIPGRLGKIVVYKSGKTVLVLEGPSGKPKVCLNITEGLTCGFRQQAVSLDVEKSEFVTLGDIDKTIVATPDLTHFVDST